MAATLRSWGKSRPIDTERRLRVIVLLATCPEMTYEAIAERTGMSKTSIGEINRESKARRPSKAEVN